MGVSVDSKSATRDMTVAICGNPNCGKTTLFNAITGLRQKVGNYPGVTVEKTTGTFQAGDSPARRFQLIDTPGSYSLAAFSPDEFIATRVLCGSVEKESRPDIIICVIDATSLERGLYLLYQVMQVGRPVLVALNMVDLATRHGIRIDVSKLSEALGGMPVIPVVASKRKGINRLKNALARLADNPRLPSVQAYDPLTDEVLEQLIASCSDREFTRAEFLRVLFDRSGPAEEAFLRVEEEAGRSLLEDSRRRVTDKFGSLSTAETAPLTQRAAEVYSRVARIKSTSRPTRSERLDRFLLHPILGPAVLVALMVFMFHSVFSWAEPAMNFIDSLFGALAGQVETVMAEGPLRSLLIDGLIGGVGSVLVFLPQIVILFLFIAFLEDSGYMTRAAFLVDRLFGWCGLSGKSFVPLLSSFACAIPGIMATRTIENRNLRMVTIMVAPLMSCSARLPIYTIMIAAFIPHQTYFGVFNSRGLILTCLYLLGLVVAVAIAFVFKKLVFKNERGTFMTELPSYNMPALRSVMIRIINRVQAFIKRAGTVILAITIIIWTLSYYPRSSDISSQFESETAAVEAQFLQDEAALEQLLAQQDEVTSAQSGVQLEARHRTLEIEHRTRLTKLRNDRAGAQLSNSYFGRVGRLVAPLFAPLGWDWKITMAALTSFPAREVVIATLGTIYNLGTGQDETSVSLVEKMRNARWENGSRRGQRVMSPASALSIMVFFALCAQCGATLVTIRQESGRWLYSVIAFVYLTSLAYVGALVVYQVFSRMGL